MTTEPERQPLRPTYPLSECCTQAGLGGGWELAGDPDTGCVWMQALDIDDDLRISTMWPEGYTVSFHPLRVYDNSGDLAAEAGVRYGMGGNQEENPPEECQQDSAPWPGTWRVYGPFTTPDLAVFPGVPIEEIAATFESEAVRNELLAVAAAQPAGILVPPWLPADGMTVGRSTSDGDGSYELWFHASGGRYVHLVVRGGLRGSPLVEVHGFSESEAARVRASLRRLTDGSDHIWTVSNAGSGEQASLSGTVGNHPFDCFYMQETGETIVWPEGTVGTEGNADGPGVVLPGGETVLVGTAISGRGQHQPGTAGPLYGIAPECVTEQLTVFQYAELAPEPR